jgi:hypothetical protein
LELIEITNEICPLERGPLLLQSVLQFLTQDHRDKRAEHRARIVSPFWR